MVPFEGQDILNFIKELPNDEACKAYLAKIKWQDGFTCSKYGHTIKAVKSQAITIIVMLVNMLKVLLQTHFFIKLNLVYKKHFVSLLK
jgi:hypothetical protein